MAFVINSRVLSEKLVNRLDQKEKENIDSLEKLSSGVVFTSTDPRPADRALTEGLEFKLRSLSASKRNINDAISLLQTAESGFSEVNNIMTRMKEINTAAATTTMSDSDRKFLFVEYQALYDEIGRIAKTVQFNGIPLLYGKADNTPESLIFRVDDPFKDAKGSSGNNDINTIRFDGLKNVDVTPEGLGLQSAENILKDSEDGKGIDLASARDMMQTDDDNYATAYDKALSTLSTHRAVFGGMQERLNHAMEFNDVFAENIAAAKSKISDTDYASEVTRMAQNNILVQATTGLIAQNNVNSTMALNLISSALKT